MPLSIATWNVNSVRLREGLLCDLLEEARPDVICLQECKSPVEKIPRERVADLGYPHMIARGFKGYNGVAILSKRPIEEVCARPMCGREDARHIAARLPDGTVVHNFYVPAGGDEPDRAVNDKFAHKLDFLEEMRGWFAAERPERSILVGDLNIAPEEEDVWSHRQLLNVVSHTPIEVEALNGVRDAGGWVDVMRAAQPEGKLYSWWSYRARDWEAADKGRRLDHVWATPDLAGRATSMRVLKHVRGWPKPSDHAPVVAAFDV